MGQRDSRNKCLLFTPYSSKVLPVDKLFSESFFSPLPLCSQVGSKAMVERSTIGKGAVLGQGCLVKDSIVMEGAVIGNGVHLNQVIVGRGAVVKEGSQLSTRCLLGEGVILEAGVIVPELTRILAALENIDDDCDR